MVFGDYTSVCSKGPHDARVPAVPLGNRWCSVKGESSGSSAVCRPGDGVFVAFLPVTARCISDDRVRGVGGGGGGASGEEGARVVPRVRRRRLETVATPRPTRSVVTSELNESDARRRGRNSNVIMVAVFGRLTRGRRCGARRFRGSGWRGKKTERRATRHAHQSEPAERRRTETMRLKHPK